MNGTTLALVLGSCFLSACGQLLLRTGAEGRAEPISFLNAYIALGLAAYGAATVLWICGLATAKLVNIYPFTLITFILVGAGAVALLGERVNGMTAAGWTIAVFGVAVAWIGSR